MGGPSAPQGRGGSGIFVAVVLVLALVLVGAIYFWKASSNRSLESGGEANQQAQVSDSTDSIEADLNATDVNSVDYDLDESNFTAS